MLKETFIHLCNSFTKDLPLINELWAEIEENYSQPERQYHTLSHLNNLLKQLNDTKDKIENWETVLFTLFYHDIVYNVLNSDNEDQSADLAEKRMKQMSVPVQLIKNCKAQILSTKAHLENELSDTNYFTDADLSILGQDCETYKAYSENVRKEYSVYPDSIYKPGRKKVLQHFIEMKRIYKTDLFFNKFEIQAKQNLKKELDNL